MQKRSEIMRLVRKVMTIIVALWVVSMLIGGNVAEIIELLTVCIDSLMPVVIILIGIVLMIRSLLK